MGGGAGQGAGPGDEPGGAGEPTSSQAEVGERPPLGRRILRTSWAVLRRVLKFGGLLILALVLLIVALLLLLLYSNGALVSAVERGLDFYNSKIAGEAEIAGRAMTTGSFTT